MKSIRISDALYERAQAQATFMSRSISQQLEHWMRLGLAAEKTMPAEAVLELLSHQDSHPEQATGPDEPLRQALLSLLDSKPLGREFRHPLSALLQSDFEMSYGDFSRQASDKQRQLVRQLLSAHWPQAPGSGARKKK
jgi:hypothetical protein